MRFPRVLAFGQRLLDGRVLAANVWWTADGITGRDTELYDPASGIWESAGEMPGPDGGPTVLLPSGRVLSVGGWDADRVQLSRAVAVYHPEGRTWRALDPLPDPLFEHNLTLLGTGKVLLTGGCRSSFYWWCGLPVLLEGKLFDPENETWTATSPMRYPRFHGSSATLPSGKALVVGGNLSLAPAVDVVDYYVTPAAEVYDPWRDLWETTPVMPHYVNYAGALAVLPSGEVMHTGGGILDGLGFSNKHTKGISATQIFRE
jgi:N-acetylneuraminic acid mutarotase